MAYDADIERLVFVGGKDNTVVFLDVSQFLRDHGAHAVRVKEYSTEFLVYDEEGTLGWVTEDSLERQSTADIKSVPTKKPS